MNVHYKFVNWRFDTGKFAQAVLQMHENFSWKELAELMDVSASTVNNWANGNFHPSFPHPHMVNFLVVCNMLDLDPREFWCYEDV